MLRSNSRKFLAGLMLFGTLGCLSSSLSVIADMPGRPIKNIYACTPADIVVEFEESSGMPGAPHILDLPGPNHRVVLDFCDASFEEGMIADPEAISLAVNRVLPNVKAVHYTNLRNSDKSVARLVLDLDPSAQVNPRVIELSLGQVTLSLADKTATRNARAAAANTADNSTPTNAAGTIANTAVSMIGNTTHYSTATANTDQGTKIADAVGFASPASQDINTDDRSIPGATDGVPSASNSRNASIKKSDAATPIGGDSKDFSGSPRALLKTSAAPSDPGERALDALKHYNTAVKLHLVGKLSDAVTEYQMALALNPQLSEAHSNLGLVYNQQHNYAQALSEFRKALSINPRDAITYNGIGAALRAEKDLPGAIKNWETAVECDPHLATASYNLGTAYELQKEYDRAVKAYQQAVKNDYRLGEAYYRIGLIMERQHRFQDATQEFNQALKASATAEYSEDARQRLAYLEQNKKISKR